jgi:hypothetical protein
VDPRIFCIPALRAPVVAVLRRGPSDWFHVGKWDLAGPTFESGSWLRGTIYPQRCDLSPDGTWLSYFALKASAIWDLGATYVAISKLPWLTALAAWGTGGTWTRGMHFVEDRRVWHPSDPEFGGVDLVRQRYGMEIPRAQSFAVERRRGWSETAETPPRAADDAWDEQRGDAITLEKRRPGGDGAVTLRVGGSYAGHRSMHGHRADIRYELQVGEDRRDLRDVQWADWSPDGRLIVATNGGRLQVRELDDSVGWEVDLSALKPDPEPPPDTAAS